MTWTSDQCRARADEAETLAQTVAYERDRDRLREEARSWREQARLMDARAQQWREAEPPHPAGSLLSWLRWR